MRILIVEDEPVLAVEMEMILLRAGHTIIGIAWDEGAAAEIASGHRADLALVDLHLANQTSGAVAARQLRTRYGTPSLFVSASPA